MSGLVVSLACGHRRYVIHGSDGVTTPTLASCAPCGLGLVDVVGSRPTVPGADVHDADCPIAGDSSGGSDDAVGCSCGLVDAQARADDALLGIDQDLP